ncbi:Putative metabolite transport protein NicT [Cupriavidus yeoncheonensis]|uniref:Metabolite transport protein NicT n=1 Tax=Cupriavidus yeoncheonensis TaxID=1462994 RepID=A0A916N6Y7_9BURK|nr:MFS transporter [Cupriavidus yeoncheonensis]CAG2155174.1 Putative metabolite transport protein NicT [Cupriavidus yeoncheonensis]
MRPQVNFESPEGLPAPPDFRTANPAASEDGIYAKVTRRLVGFLFVCFIFAFLDRINVGFAKIGMQADLGFSEAVFGLGAGIFFVSYFLLEVPSNLLLGRFGARRWIARIMVTWGLLSMATMFVRTPAHFYVLRLLLGAAEAGFFPGVMLYLTQWYPAHRRGRVITLFMAAIPVSSIFGSPLSGWILRAFDGQGGMAAWQWLYLVEGVPAVLLGWITLRYLPDNIAQAKWLSPGERHLLQQRVASDAHHASAHRMRDAFRSPLVWLLAFINFAFLCGITLAFWMPSMLRNAGVKSTVEIGWMVAIPYVLAVIGMLVLGRTSDASGERRWHSALPGFAAAAGLAVMPWTLDNPTLLLAASTVAISCNVVANALYWNLPTAFMSGAAAAVGLAFVNAFGQIAGFASPSVFGWLFATTGSASLGLGVLAACLALGSMAVLLMPAQAVNR